jgi:hypothetical protein
MNDHFKNLIQDEKCINIHITFNIVICVCDKATFVGILCLIIDILAADFMILIDERIYQEVKDFLKLNNDEYG